MSSDAGNWRDHSIDARLFNTNNQLFQSAFNSHRKKRTWSPNTRRPLRNLDRSNTRTIQPTTKIQSNTPSVQDISTTQIKSLVISTTPSVQDISTTRPVQKLSLKIQPKTIIQSYQHEPIKEKVSLGITCVRYHNNQPEILMVCKRYTYYFNMFCQGKYNSKDNNTLMKLFNGMTVEEKIDILSLKFSIIWYRIWLTNTYKSGNYFLAKNKFEKTFLLDQGERLRNLIAKSSSEQKFWELPKGRKINKFENDIHTAIREFREETGILKDKYTVFPEARNTYSYIDDNVRYTNVYYIAFAKHAIDAKINFARQDQIDEICDIRWMDINAVRHIDATGRLVPFIKPIFKFIRKNVRQY